MNRSKCGQYLIREVNIDKCKQTNIMAVDNTFFLTPLLASCAAITAFLGNRHQHLSGLICKKTEYIFINSEELEQKDVQNIMAQITLLRDRNSTVEIAVLFSLFGAIGFALCIFVFHIFPGDISILGWILISFGILLLGASLYHAIFEFVQSSLTLDLEIFLGRSKYRKIAATQGILGFNDLLMYGESKEQQQKYLDYLLKQAADVGKKQQEKILRKTYDDNAICNLRLDDLADEDCLPVKNP